MTLQTFQLLGVALAPIAAIIAYVWFRDRADNKEPFRLLLLCFVFGIVSTGLAIGLEVQLANLGLVIGESLASVFVFAFVTVALSEEFSKFIFLRGIAWSFKHFDEPYDGIIYTLMIGMGFATVENLLYVFGQETYEASLAVAKLRAITAVPAHATFAVLMGYFAGLAKFHPSQKFGLLLAGFALAVVFHGAYDFFLMQEHYPSIVGGAFVSLIVAVGLSLRAIRAHQRRGSHT